jgi:hypothetical protein
VPTKTKIKLTIMTTIELGNIGSKEQVEKLTAKLSGQTYMNFIVDYSISAGNYPLLISTERENTTEDELKDMVLFYLACHL